MLRESAVCLKIVHNFVSYQNTLKTYSIGFCGTMSRINKRRAGEVTALLFCSLSVLITRSETIDAVGERFSILLTVADTSPGIPSL